MNRKIATRVRVALIVLCVLAVWAIPAAATADVPAGATITRATFSVYVTNPSHQTVRLHRITAPWTEHGVTWNNFGGRL